MMTRVLSVVAVLGTLLAVAPRANRAASVAAVAPHPWYGAWGVDLSGMDTTVRPGVDFFRYVNGRRVDRATIPPDRAGTSLRLRMSDTTEARLHSLMLESGATATHQPASLDGKVAAFYRSFMDTLRIERLGDAPVEPLLAEIRRTHTKSQLAALMGRSTADLYGSIFDVGIDVDEKDPKIYSVYIGQAGLTLPSRDFYVDSSFAAQREALRKCVATLLGLAKWPDAAHAADSVVALETRIARVSWTNTQQRNPVAMFNPMSADSLASFAPGFDWHAFLDAAQLGDVHRVIVLERGAFPQIASVFATTPLATTQAYLAFTVLYDAGPYLSRPFADAWFDLHDQALNGVQQQPVRWRSAVHAVSGGDYAAGDRFERFGNLGWAVGQLYTDRYFPPASKAKIESLVVNLMTAMHARIAQLDWMTPQTKAEALKKLDTYTIKVGYPDHPRDYSTVVIRDDDLLGNVRRAAAADWTFFVRRRPGPVDRSEWIMTPQTNDAYNGNLRDIVFPAAILQPPIFDPEADPAVNYGAAGGVIGHELTHGFDDQGRQIDAAGALRDWWTPADAAEFTRRAKMLGAQYSQFEPLPGVHVNGDLTMGENIADLGGVTLALDAYRASLHGTPAPVLDGYTGDQRVFLGWAQAWSGKVRDAAVRKQVASDPHSPRQFRVNGPVRNIDAWYDLFGVTPSDSLYLPPAARVRLW